MEVCRLENGGELDKFVASHPHGLIEQSFGWGGLQKTIPGRDEFFALAVKEDGKVVASMLLIRQSMGRGKTWLWCPRGPLLPEVGGEAWELLLEAAKNLAILGSDVFLRIEPGVPVGESFVVEGREVKESYMPVNTLLLDLSVSEEEILKQMAQKGRYNIKKAEKAGVEVREAKDLDGFYEVLKDTAARDGFHQHEKRFYEAVAKVGKLYLAYFEDELLGGLLATHFGKTATYYFGASSSSHREKMAPYALQWHAIREAKKAGMKRYDFLGIAPEGDSQHVLAGVTQFKTRFGGERVKYHGARVVVFRRFWWLAYSLVKRFKS